MTEITPKEAIANLNHIYGMVAPDIQRSLDVAIKALERPTGEWEIITFPHSLNKYKCNQCQHYLYSGMDRNFCPNCGADMRGTGNE